MSSPRVVSGGRTDPSFLDEESAGQCNVQGSDPVSEILREQCELAIARQIRGLDQLAKEQSTDFEITSEKFTFSWHSQWMTNESPYFERMIKSVQVRLYLSEFPAILYHELRKSKYSD